MSDFDPPPGNAAPRTPAALIDAVKRGAVLITSNERAARFLRGQVNALFRQSGLESWATAAIFNWNAWLAGAWEGAAWKGSNLPAALSGEQEHALWVRIIAGASDAAPQAHDALAELARNAWALLHEYEVELGGLRGAATPRTDWQQFNEWQEKFQRRIAKAQWLTQAQLSGELRRRLSAGEWTPPAELIVWGFDTCTPAQESLLQSVSRQASVTRIAPANADAPERAQARRSLRLGSRDEEFYAAARWAGLRLKENPASRLAIITTQASQERGALQRALSLELAPGQFAFALGRAISQFSVARTALLLLGFARGRLTAADISDLLLAPRLIADPAERDERVLFEANVFRRRDIADPTMDLFSFTDWLRGAMAARRPASLTKLLRQCEAASRVQAKARARMGAEDWAEHFAQTLAAFEYPAGALSTVEFQIWNDWQKLLQSFAQTSVWGEMLDHAQALSRLQQMAARTIFQPESADASVEIMGPLEAAGSLFDGVFFTGCTDQRWPLAAQPNPLLPLALQRAAGMPAAVPGATLERGLQMTERILQSAPEVLFSHAERDKDGDPRPSPVLARLQIPQADDLFCDTLCADRARPAPVLVEMNDTFGPGWPATGPALSSSALRSQAACPFQGFALYRLHARGEELPEEGFDAAQRGSMLHTALEKIWRGGNGLQTSTALHELIDHGGLEAFVRERVKESLPAAAGGWQREYFLIERDRLTRLLCDWLLKVEATRPAFIVLETEKEHSLELIESLKFRVRPDRVDALIPNAGLSGESPPAATAEDLPDPYEVVLLDYKTGQISNKEWTTPRMDEPQLPLYALYAFAEAPAAIAIGSIRGGEEPCVKGAAARADILPLKMTVKQKANAAADYAACLEAWRADLEMLAEEFVAGKALVAPKRGDATCKYCTLQPLCRVHETNSLLDADDSDNEKAEQSNG